MGVGGSKCRPDHPNPTNRVSPPFSQPSSHELPPPSNPGIQPGIPPTSQTAGTQRPQRRRLLNPSRPKPPLITTRRRPRRCQLRHITRQPHGPQHPLDRVRILNRREQAARTLATRTNEHLDREYPQQLLGPCVVATASRAECRLLLGLKRFASCSESLFLPR